MPDSTHPSSFGELLAALSPEERGIAGHLLAGLLAYRRYRRDSSLSGGLVTELSRGTAEPCPSDPGGSLDHRVTA